MTTTVIFCYLIRLLTNKIILHLQNLIHCNTCLSNSMSISRFALRYKVTLTKTIESYIII